MDFKIGDKVRITGCCADFTDHLDGKLGEVVSVRSNDIGVIVEGEDKPLPWYIWKDNAEVVKEEKKVFTKEDIKTGMFGVMNDGVEFVIANNWIVYKHGGYDDTNDLNTNLEAIHRKVDKLYEGVKSFNQLERCLKDNSYVDSYGYNLVYDRERDTKPALYNGKVVCIDNSNNPWCYTVGKIYQFVDGIFYNDSGNWFDNYGEPFTSFEEWSKWTSDKFIEIKE